MKSETVYYFYTKYTEKYINYITRKRGIGLFRNSKPIKLPLYTYLSEEKSIPSSKLTPIPYIKRKPSTKNEDFKKFITAERCSVSMRIIEYTSKLKAIKPKSYFYFLGCIQLIQKKWKLYLTKKIRKCIVIQKKFKAFYLKNYIIKYQIEYARKSNAINIIKNVMIKNFLRIRIIKKSCGKFITKFIYRTVPQLLYLQRSIREFLYYIKIKKRVLNKVSLLYKSEKCPLYLIRRIQKNIKLYLKKIKQKIIKPHNIYIIKILRPIEKIKLLQRFFRYLITKSKPRKLIDKQKFKNNYIFSKEFKPQKNKKELFQNIHVYINNTKKLEELQTTKYHIKSTKEYYCKNECPLIKIISIQREFRICLKIMRMKYRRLIKCKTWGFIIKNVMKYQSNKIRIIQKNIRYFLYRINSKNIVFKKQRIEPMKFSKIVSSQHQKLLNRVIQVRVSYDKNLINFIVTIYWMLRKHFLLLLLMKSKQPKTKLTVQIRKSLIESKDSLPDNPLDYLPEYKYNEQTNISNKEDEKVGQLKALHVNKKKANSMLLTRNKITNQNPINIVKLIGNNKNNKNKAIKMITIRDTFNFEFDNV